MQLLFIDDKEKKLYFSVSALLLALCIYIALSGSKWTESPAQSWLCPDRVLLMLLKSLSFYPIWGWNRGTWHLRQPSLLLPLPPRRKAGQSIRVAPVSREKGGSSGENAAAVVWMLLVVLGTDGAHPLPSSRRQSGCRD